MDETTEKLIAALGEEISVKPPGLMTEGRNKLLTDLSFAFKQAFENADLETICRMLETIIEGLKGETYKT